MMMNKDVLRYRLWQAYRAPYFAVKNSYVYWYLTNRRLITAYRAKPPQLLPIQQKLVAELCKDGLAVSTLEELFPHRADLLSVLQREARQLAEMDTSLVRKKPFLRYFFRSGDTSVPYTQPFVALALETRLLDIVGAYFKTYAHLEYITGNIVSPVREGTEPETSQRWHRDPGSIINCKIFVYLTDVVPGSGPFTLLKGSQPHGRNQDIAPHRFFGEGSYYPKTALVEAGIERLYAQKDLAENYGKAGTVIFANTLALHRGGYATAKPREMLTFYYRPVRSERPPQFLNVPARLPAQVGEAIGLYNGDEVV